MGEERAGERRLRAGDAGRTWRLTRPRLVHDQRRRAMPAPVRFLLGLQNVAGFLDLAVDDGTADQVGPRSAG